MEEELSRRRFRQHGPLDCDLRGGRSGNEGEVQ